MGAFVSWLSTDELEKLDPHKLLLLKAAVEREVASSPEIKKILEGKYRAVYERMTEPGGATAPTAPPKAPKGKKG